MSTVNSCFLFRSKMTDEEKKQYLAQRAKARKKEYKEKLRKKMRDSRRVKIICFVLNLADCLSGPMFTKLFRIRIKIRLKLKILLLWTFFQATIIT